MDHAIAPSFSTGQPICKAGIDLALHDLGESCTDSPSPSAWNQHGRDQITLSWTLNPRSLDEVEGLSRRAGSGAIRTST